MILINLQKGQSLVPSEGNLVVVGRETGRNCHRCPFPTRLAHGARPPLLVAVAASFHRRVGMLAQIGVDPCIQPCPGRQWSSNNLPVYVSSWRDLRGILGSVGHLENSAIGIFSQDRLGGPLEDIIPKNKKQLENKDLPPGLPLLRREVCSPIRRGIFSRAGRAILEQAACASSQHRNWTKRWGNLL